MALAVAFGSPAWAADAPASDAKPAAEPAKATEPAPEAKPAEAKPAEAKPAEAKTDVPRLDQPLLIEGAPLGNANVGVHIVEKKPYTNAGRFELAVYPAVLQINGKFTQHFGVGLMFAYHIFENMAVQITPIYNYWNRVSGFNQELIDKGHQQAQAATALLLQYGAVAGVEITPIYGKFAFYQGTLAHFSFVLSAGAGAGSTRIQLQGDQQTGCGPGTDTPDCRTATFGDTGFKFVGSVGAGFRVLLGDRVAIRLEVRDLIYTARVDKINGCTYEDLVSIYSGGNPVNGSCSGEDAFGSVADRNQAQALLKQTSSDVLNNVSFYAGVSFLF
jgi:outer membrane beta-barrel protein